MAQIDWGAYLDAEPQQTDWGAYLDSAESPPPSQPASQPQSKPKEQEFQQWWNTNPSVMEWRKAFKEKYGEEPQQDIPEYDYRKAFAAGEVPKPVPQDDIPHWSSQFKGPNHPNRFVVENGQRIDTITGKPATEQSTPQQELPDFRQMASTVELAPVDYKNGSQWEKDVSAKGINVYGRALVGNGWLPYPSSSLEYRALSNDTKYVGADGNIHIKDKGERTKDSIVSDPYVAPENIRKRAFDVFTMNQIALPDGRVAKPSEYDRLQAAKGIVSLIDTDAPEMQVARATSELMRSNVATRDTWMLAAGVAATNAAKRIQAGEKSQDNYVTIAAYLEEARKIAEDYDKMPWYWKTVEGILQTIEFASALVPGAGAAKVTREATEQAVKKTIKSNLAKLPAKLIGELAGESARLAVSPGLQAMVAEKTVQRMAPQDMGLEGLSPGDPFIEAFSKSVGSQLISQLTERSGGALFKLPGIKQLKTVLARSVGKTVGEIRTAAEWNGLLGEFGEERLEDLAQGLFSGVTGDGFDFGTTGDVLSGDPDRMKRGLKNLAIEGLVLGAVGGPGMVSDTAAKRARAQQLKPLADKWARDGISATEAMTGRKVVIEDAIPVEGVLAWAVQSDNAVAARRFLGIDSPSRDQWREAGLRPANIDVRKRFVQDLRELKELQDATAVPEDQGVPEEAGQVGQRVTADRGGNLREGRNVEEGPQPAGEGAEAQVTPEAVTPETPDVAELERMEPEEVEQIWRVAVPNASPVAPMKDDMIRQIMAEWGGTRVQTVSDLNVLGDELDELEQEESRAATDQVAGVEDAGTVQQATVPAEPEVPTVARPTEPAATVPPGVSEPADVAAQPEGREGVIEAAAQIQRESGKKLPSRSEIEKLLGPTMTQEEAESYMIAVGLDEITAADQAMTAAEKSPDGIKTGLVVLSAHSALIRADSAGRRAEAIAAAGDAQIVEFSKEGSDVKYVLHPSTYEGHEGEWQLSRTDERGASGHQNFKTREEAIAAAVGAHENSYFNEGDADYRVSRTISPPQATPTAKPASQTPPVAQEPPAAAKPVPKPTQPAETPPGAPGKVSVDYSGMTGKELTAEAKKRGLKGFSGKKVDALRTMLEENDRAGEEKPTSAPTGFDAAVPEATAALESADWTTKTGERAAMQKVKDIAEKHGVSPNELWRDVAWDAVGGMDIEAELAKPQPKRLGKKKAAEPVAEEEKPTKGVVSLTSDDVDINAIQSASGAKVRIGKSKSGHIHLYPVLRGGKKAGYKWSEEEEAAIEKDLRRQGFSVTRTAVNDDFTTRQLEKGSGFRIYGSRSASPEPVAKTPSTPAEVQGKVAKQPWEMTAKEAVEAGVSYPDWDAAVTDAYRNERIGDDHPAWKSMNEQVAGGQWKQFEGQKLIGQKVTVAGAGRGARLFGEVVGATTKDGVAVVKLRDTAGGETLQYADNVDNLEAWIADRDKHGHSVPDEARKLVAPAPVEPKKLGKKTPLMQQYQAAKAASPDSIVLMRVGDFYEVMGDDAQTAADVLGLSVTKRGDVAMAGFPHHYLDANLAKLVHAGHRAVVVDQVASEPVSKKLGKKAEATAPATDAKAETAPEMTKEEYATSLWDIFGLESLRNQIKTAKGEKKKKLQREFDRLNEQRTAEVEKRFPDLKPKAEPAPEEPATDVRGTLSKKSIQFLPGLPHGRWLEGRTNQKKTERSLTQVSGKTGISPDDLRAYGESEQRKFEEGIGQKPETPLADEQVVSEEAIARVEKMARTWDAQARKDEGGIGIAAGAENINYRWAADAIRSVVQSVRAGKTPAEAGEAAKAEARTWIERHNAKRKKDIAWQRWEGSADSYVDTAVRMLTDKASKPEIPTIAPANKESIDKLLPILEKQVGNETTPRRKLQAAISVMDGEAPEVQQALVDRLKEIAPDAMEAVAETSVPIGMRDMLKPPTRDESMPDVVLAQKALPRDVSISDVERFLKREQEKGKPAWSVGDEFYSTNGKYNIGRDSKGNPRLDKLHELSRDGLMRNFDPSEYVSYNKAAMELHAELKAEEEAKRAAIAKKNADEAEAYRIESARGIAAMEIVRAGAKAMKGKKGKVKVALGGGGTREAEGTIYGNVVVIKEGKKWGLTHIPSGQAMGRTWESAGQAKEAAWLYQQELDLTQKKPPQKVIAEVSQRAAWLRPGISGEMPAFLQKQIATSERAAASSLSQASEAADKEVPSAAADMAQQNAEEDRPDVQTFGTFGGGKIKGERVRADQVPDVARNPNPEIERRLSKARGLQRPSLAQKVKEFATMAKNVITRAQEYLPNDERFAPANEFFRLLKNIPAMAQDEAIRTTASIIDPLGPQQLQLFERAAITENQLAALDMGQPLRFGFGSKEDVEAYRDQLKTAIDQTPEVAQAIETRKKVVDDTVKQLVEFDLLPESALQNTERYFHQQVHFYMEANRMSGGGTRPGKVRRSFQKARVQGEELGEDMDYNTSYVEAEVSWMTDALMEIQKEKLLRQLMEQYDIKSNLKEDAKRLNFEDLVGGPENVSRILGLRDSIKDSYESEDRDESYARQQRAKWIEELTELDPTYPYRQRIAMNASILFRREGIDIEQDGWGAVKSAADAGDPAALGIFKALREEREMIQERLGIKYRTWESMAKQQDGYDVFQPEPGNAFYRAFTIPDRIVEALQQNVIESFDLTKDELRQVLVMGNPNRQFVIPTELSNQLQEAKKKDIPHGLARVADELMRNWKVWTLLNPKRAISYNLRNMTGDLDPVVAADPSILKFTKRAATELTKYHKSHLALSADLRAARDLGVVSSGFAAQEIPDLKDLAIFQRFFEASGKPKLIGRPVSAYFDTIKPYTEFRENLLRYAAYLSYLDQLKRGKVNNYGGARKQVVMAIKRSMGNEEAAAHLARNLLGDYGNITVAGDWIRRRLMPFWSFQEINLKRVPRLAINAYEAGGTSAAAGVIGKKAAQAILLSRIAWMTGALWVWNMLLHGDDEEDLPPYDRANPHIILGRNADGSVMVFRNVGALGDFMEWFGLNELPALLRKHKDKQVDASEIVSEMMSAPIEKAVGSVRPELDVFTGAVMGQTLFPEPFAPRSIRRDEAIPDVFGLTDEYKWAKGMTLGDGSRPRRHYFQRWFVGVSDPRQTALSKIYDLRTSYLKQKGVSSAGVYPVSKYKEARDAAINDDYDAFLNWQRRFRENGGTFDDFKAFMRSLDPIASRLNEKDEQEFAEKYLTGEQREQLKVARDYAGSLESLLITWWFASNPKSLSTDSPERSYVNKIVLEGLNPEPKRTPKDTDESYQKKLESHANAQNRFREMTQSLGLDHAKAQQLLVESYRQSDENGKPQTELNAQNTRKFDKSYWEKAVALAKFYGESNPQAAVAEFRARSEFQAWNADWWKRNRP